MSHNQQDFFRIAEMYDLLANYNKYVNPTKYIAYYQQHLHYMNLASQAMRSLEIFEQQRFAAQQARVRFVHGSFNTSNVDIYINGIRVLKDFSIKDHSSYLALSAGKHQVDIYPAGNMVSTILSRKIIIEQGKGYTFIFSGDTKKLKWLAVEDDLFVSNVETKVRVIHLAHDTPTLDIAVKDRDILFPHLSYRQHTSYLRLSPMTVNLEARIAGSNEIVLLLPQTQLNPNKNYSIIIIGSIKDEPKLEALII
ncbi:DUF4397 domain-containing protein [Bacillus sp. Bva_UNVM-123]|uniref:DUF4397 domain-containing protein n=1 Tax=Bacillus sp. Bva_UNVM-123 TaxID=2829798 RepID=UPI00391F684E